MKKSRFTEAQIMGVLRQAEGGLPVSELCREHGMVILPVLTGRDRRTHAAIFSFMAGVTPPMPMFGRSLL